MKENSDWVRLRAACSAQRVFADLRAAVQSDVETRNELRNGEPIKFELRSEGDLSFSVVKEDTVGAPAVHFELKGNAITVSGNGISLRATLALNREGVCKFHISGEEIDGWLFRMKALDKLFFGS